MVNWSSIAQSNGGVVSLLQFASGQLSGRQFYELHKNTKTGGEVRNLLRERGVAKARELARKAVKRRIA